MPDLRHSAPAVVTSPDVNISELVNHHIDAGLQRARDERDARGYLGMSEIPDNCMRRVFFYHSGVKRPPMPGEQMRAQAVGDAFEILTLKWIQAAGFDVRTRNSSGQQFEFSVVGGRIKGHIDGVIVGGPELPGLRYPALWENKALKAKYWNPIAKHGLKKAEPKYWGQCQEYMDVSELRSTLFSTMNKDSSQILHLVIPYVAEDAKKMADRGLMLLGAIDKRLPPPRISSNSDFYKCKQCELREYCWSLPT